MKEEWYIIEDSEELEELFTLIKTYNVCEFRDFETQISMGYKFISDSDKATYRYMKKIADDNYKKSKEYTCSISLDYLANIFGTTKNCQRKRIINLIKAGLIKTIKKEKEFGIYQINKPKIDSTFKETALNLIERKKLKQNISKYRNCRNPITRMELSKEMDNILKKGISYPGIEQILQKINY